MIDVNKNLSLQELVDLRMEATNRKKQMEDQLEAYNKRIIEVMAKEKMGDGTRIGAYAVTIVRSFSFSKVPLEVARDMAATKETIDTEKLKDLQSKGVSIPGVAPKETLYIREIKEKGEENEE